MDDGSSYKECINEEECKLRWLITRQAAAVELRYYLVFLLVANQQYAKALKECQGILAIAPDNLIARVWTDALHRERMPGFIWRCARRRQRRVSQARPRSWVRSCCKGL